MDTSVRRRAARLAVAWLATVAAGCGWDLRVPGVRDGGRDVAREAEADNADDAVDDASDDAASMPDAGGADARTDVPPDAATGRDADACPASAVVCAAGCGDRGDVGTTAAACGPCRTACRVAARCDLPTCVGTCCTPVLGWDGGTADVLVLLCPAPREIVFASATVAWCCDPRR